MTVKILAESIKIEFPRVVVHKPEITVECNYPEAPRNVIYAQKKSFLVKELLESLTVAPRAPTALKDKFFIYF